MTEGLSYSPTTSATLGAKKNQSEMQFFASLQTALTSAFPIGAAMTARGHVDVEPTQQQKGRPARSTGLVKRVVMDTSLTHVQDRTKQFWLT